MLDQAGVLAAISQVFAKWDISIGSVIQKESNDISQTAELVVLTHVSKESAVQQAAKEIIALAEVESIGSLIRVESDVWFGLGIDNRVVGWKIQMLTGFVIFRGRG